MRFEDLPQTEREIEGVTAGGPDPPCHHPSVA